LLVIVKSAKIVQLKRKKGPLENKFRFSNAIIKIKSIYSYCASLDCLRISVYKYTGWSIKNVADYI